MTICDALEKSLKKGKGEEQAQAAVCCVLVLLQLGVCVDSEDLYKELRPILTTIMADNSMSPKGRSAVSINLIEHNRALFAYCSSILSEQR